MYGHLPHAQIAINRALLDEARLRWGGERKGGGDSDATSSVSTSVGMSRKARMEDKPDGRGSNEKATERPLSGEVTKEGHARTQCSMQNRPRFRASSLVPSLRS